MSEPQPRRRGDRGDRGLSSPSPTPSSPSTPFAKTPTTPSSTRSAKPVQEDEDDLLSRQSTTTMWVPDGEGGFQIAEIVERALSGNEVTVQIKETGQRTSVRINDIHPVNPAKLDKIDDMARLSHLNEPSVLNNLKLRYNDDNIYTYSGLFLVAVNPYKRIPIYTDDIIKKHNGKRREDVAPHVFTISDVAYRQMLQNKKDQSMLITGESGAGKTENTKRVIQYLTAVAGSHHGGGKLEQQLINTNPLLEAFGNAKTTRNNNSSRFGKFIEIDFNGAGFIVGCKIQNYLLEATRVVSQNPNERNFHFFYQLCQNAEAKSKYKLGAIEDYKILNQSGCTSVDNIDDKAEYAQTLQAMDVIGLNEVEREEICSLVASLLQFGNVEFGRDAEGLSNLPDKTQLQLACSLVGVDAAALELGFTKPKIVAGNDIIETHVSDEQAGFNRNALIKSLYSRLFDWLVRRINESLAPKESIRNFIGVLDIAGFEIFQQNNFEQLCINYTNEKLQQFFNSHMFKREQEEYLKEKIEWKFIDFGLDLQPTIDLIEKNLGIMAILEQQTFLPKTNEETLTREIVKNHNGKPNFKTDRFDPISFSIVHYAGEVKYSTKGWLQKNIDPLNEDCKAVMRASRKKFISNLFPDDETPMPGSSKKPTSKSAKFTTVSDGYRTQLRQLMAVLESTEPHFIRCIVPNSKQKPGIIEPPLVLHQLRCNGVLEGIRISRKGYPGRILFKDFEARFRLFMKKSQLDKLETAGMRCEALLKAAGLQETKHYKIGTSKVFLRSGTEAFIEDLRDKKVAEIILVAQAALRGRMARRRFEGMKNRTKACATIQKNFRAFLQLKDWGWWQIFQRARPIVKANAATEKLILKEIEALKGQLEEKQQITKGAKDERDVVAKEVAGYQAQLDAAKKQQEEARQNIEAIKKQISDLEGLVVTLSNEKRLSEGERNQLLSQLSEKESRLKSREGEIGNQSAELGSLQASIESMKKTAVERDNSIIKLEAQSKKYEEELKRWKAKVEEEQIRAGDIEKLKQGIEARIADVQLSLENVARARNDSQQKNTDLATELNDRTKEIKTLKSNIEQSTYELEQIKTELGRRDEDFKERSRTLTDLDKEKKKIDALVKDLSDRLAEETRKKTALEAAVRTVQFDVSDQQANVQTLKDLKQGLEEQLSKQQEDMATLKKQLAVLGEQKNRLESERANLEKEIKDTNAKLGDELERAKQQIQRLAQKTDEQIKDLGGASAEIVTTKEKLEKKLVKRDKEFKELERAHAQLQSDKEAALLRIQEAQRVLMEAQTNLESEKSASSNLERDKRDLHNELKNLNATVSGLQEESARMDSRIKQASRELTDAQEHAHSVEAALESLKEQREHTQSIIAKLKAEIESLKSEIAEVQAARNALYADVKSLKSQIQAIEEKNQELEAKLKPRDEDHQKAYDDIEKEKNENILLERQSRKLEAELARIQKLLATLENKANEETEKKDALLTKLKQTELQLSAAKSDRDDSKRKLKAMEDQVAKANQDLYEVNKSVAKLRNEKRDMESKIEKLQSAKEKAKLAQSSKDGASQMYESQVADYEERVRQERDLRASAEQSILTLKQELENTKEQAERDAVEEKQLVTQVLQTIKANEDQYQAQIKELNADKAALRAENRRLRNTPTTAVSPQQSALDKIKSEYENEITRTQSKLREAQAARLQADKLKTHYEGQMQELRFKLEREEQNKKKADNQKRALEAEAEELKELAEEAEHLRDEVAAAKKKKEASLLATKKEIESARFQRQQAEAQAAKLRDEVQALKKAITSEREKESTIEKTVRTQLETEVASLKAQLKKAQKDDTNLVAKTLDRERRELARKLEKVTEAKQELLARKTKVEAEIEAAKGEIEHLANNSYVVESKAQMLVRQLQQFKERVTRLENEKKKLTSELSQHKKVAQDSDRKLRIAAASRRVADSDDDDDLGLSADVGEDLDLEEDVASEELEL